MVVRYHTLKSLPLRQADFSGLEGEGIRPLPGPDGLRFEVELDKPSPENAAAKLNRYLPDRYIVTADDMRPV